MEQIFRFLLLLYLVFFSIFSTRIAAVDTLSSGQSIKDGDTLVSADGTFELGFFSPTESSTKRYLGIWYKKLLPYGQTVVWVANRDNPISDTRGVLIITTHGILTLLNATNTTIWSSNTSGTRHDKEPFAQLLNSGNLVVRDGEDNNQVKEYLWQSFDYPSDSLLPGMKIGKNLETGFEWFMSSWKSTDNPAIGQYSTRLNLSGYPQLVIMKGSKIRYRAGPWNGLRLSASPSARADTAVKYEFVMNENEVYITTKLIDISAYSRLTLNPSGNPQRVVWSDKIHDWEYLGVPDINRCENYAICGTYASCNLNASLVCSCLKGFIPRSTRKWNSNNWSDGCVRRTSLACDNAKDGFLKHPDLKLPDTSLAKVNMTMNLEECKQLCLSNCSCTAYANSDIKNGGTGCMQWFGDLIDMKDLEEGGQDVHIRVAASEIDNIMQRRQSWKKKLLIIIISSIIVGMGMLVIAVLYRQFRKRKRKEKEKEEMELPIFSFATIANATNNFSNENKLGEGGFGPVYKGTLSDGQDIAVKRLSKNSGQGLTEFKNEVLLIAKLQHRNLVKLLGCCIHGNEKVLIYEYMANKSLDYFIFDQARSKLLDWHKRMDIISGIARGLLYLHQDSRLRIIHRDLKSSNILLDNAMNPKISDFGLARTFCGEQTKAQTNRVVGTYGYMAPEYAIDGLFSMKSDVFSFGVLILEIVSGKKNRGFLHSDHNLNLLGHAWRLWTENRAMELIDDTFRASCVLAEAQRCIHVGLLCVQQRSENRPNMSSVVLMLSSEGALPQPKTPGFFTERNLPEFESSSSNYQLASINEITISMLEPR